MIHASSPAGTPSARLRVRALRLIAERRVGRRLTHVGAMELLERHGGVDAAIEAMVADLAPKPARAGIVPVTTTAPVVHDSRESDELSAHGDATVARVAETALRIRRVALAGASAVALSVGAAALGRVVVAAQGGHGARSTLVLGSALLLAALVTGVGALRRRLAPRPAREIVVLGLSAAAAVVVQAAGACALTPPFGLGRLLVDPVPGWAIALVAAATAVAAGAALSDPVSRSPEPAGNRTPDRSCRRR